MSGRRSTSLSALSFLPITSSHFCTSVQLPTMARPPTSSVTRSRLHPPPPSRSFDLLRSLLPSSLTDLTVSIPSSTSATSTSPSASARGLTRPSSPSLQIDSTRRPGLAAARAARSLSPAGRREVAQEAAGKGRWRTREFYLYYAVFALVLPRMGWSVIRLSRGELRFCCVHEG